MTGAADRYREGVTDISPSVARPAAIAGQTVVLRPTDAEHVPTFLAILAHPEIAKRWGGYDLRRVRRDLLGPNCYAVELAGEVVGLVIYREERDPDHRHATLDIALHPDAQGQGLGADALRSIARFLFDSGHHRVTIDPAAHNTRAIRSCSRAGFRPVGVLRSYERDPETGEWHDGLLMDLLPTDLAR